MSDTLFHPYFCSCVSATVCPYLCHLHLRHNHAGMKPCKHMCQEDMHACVTSLCVTSLLKFEWNQVKVHFVIITCYFYDIIARNILHPTILYLQASPDANISTLFWREYWGMRLWIMKWTFKSQLVFANSALNLDQNDRNSNSSMLLTGHGSRQVWPVIKVWHTHYNTMITASCLEKNNTWPCWVYPVSPELL